jgi:hypothetical protein
MTRGTVKNCVGAFLLLTQAFCIGGVVVLMGDYLQVSDGLDVLFIVAPIFSAYSMAVVREFLRGTSDAADARVAPFGFVFVSFLFPVLFACALAAVLWGFRIGVIESIDTLKRAFAAVETVFGVYVGAVTHALFTGGEITATDPPTEVRTDSPVT